MSVPAPMCMLIFGFWSALHRGGPDSRSDYVAFGFIAWTSPPLSGRRAGSVSCYVTTRKLYGGEGLFSPVVLSVSSLGRGGGREWLALGVRVCIVDIATRCL